jgi:hypothetical protein
MKTKKNLSMVPGLFWICSGFITGLPIVLTMIACAGGAPLRDEGPGFSGVLGKDWQLIEIRKESGNISLDRAGMEADGLGDAFTLRFDEDRISGRALPNLYFGPYTRTGQALRLEKIAATLMANFRTINSLTETEYFDYLWQVESWAWRGDNLELHTINPEGQQAVLIFR